jgi:hypothetical protein
MPSLNAQNEGPGSVGNAAGLAVIHSPFSGPTGSPFDNDQSGNYSTGGLNTGIGFGIGTLNHINPVAPGSVRNAGFTVGAVPGVSLPDNTSAADARLLAVGGGRSTLVDGTGPDGNGTPPGTTVSVPNPYGAQPILAYGNGGSRDAGAGPAFTGYSMNLLTANANVNHGAAINGTTFVNRVKPGVALPAQYSAFGSNGNASPPVA